jgi:hypothetical protein
MGWVEYVAKTAERIKAHRIVVVKFEGKRQLGRGRGSA